MKEESEYLSAISELEKYAYKFIMSKEERGYSQYFGEVLKIFSKVFEQVLGENYNFCSISYVTKTGTTYDIQPLDYLGKEGTNISSTECIVKLLDFVREHPQVSLTQTLVQSEGDEDILFYRSDVSILEYQKSLYRVDFSCLTDDLAENEQILNNDSFDVKFRFFVNPEPPTVTQLLTYYKKIADIFSTETNKNFFFYFIKPVTKQFEAEFGVIASIAVSRPLNQLELALINLLLGKVLYEPQLLDKERERNRKNEQIESLQNVSASTHALKTFIDVKFGSIINTLEARYPSETIIKTLNESKEDLLASAELINIMSKLNMIGEDIDVNIKVLNSSKFKFFEPIVAENTIFDLLDQILEVKNLDSNFKFNNRILFDIKLNGYKVSRMDNDPFKFNKLIQVNGLYATNYFLKLIIYTIFENVLKHGVNSRQKVLSIDVNDIDKTITFSNETDIKYIYSEKLSGNLKIIRIILKKLKIADLHSHLDLSLKKYSLTFKIK